MTANDRPVCEDARHPFVNSQKERIRFEGANDPIGCRQLGYRDISQQSSQLVLTHNT